MFFNNILTMTSPNIDETIKILEENSQTDLNILEICLKLTEEVKERKTSICAVIEKLGKLLVNKNPEQRELGVSILSQIIILLPDDFLTSVELNFISCFYSDRLKDHHQVIPTVLRGVHALAQTTNLPDESPQIILTALFQNISCQQQQVKDREIIYQIFMELLSRKVEVLQFMGLDFVVGIIQAIDGERDPRNLLMLFKWLPTFLTTVKLEHLAEEMFDVIACYFPVDFRPSANDSQVISREDLSSTLCLCLCAIPEFDQYCLPLIIDKINSSSKVAKCDSLTLLTESCKVFKPSIYEQHSKDIWNVLQRDLLNTNDPEIEEPILNCISAVINKLSTSENITLFKQLIDNIYDTLKGNLQPDHKLYLPSSKILLAITRASKESCKILAQSTISLLLNQFNLNKDSNHKEMLMRTIIVFATAYTKLFDVTNIMDVDALNEIPALCLQIFTDNSEIELQIISFESLPRIAKMLPETIRTAVYNVLKEYIIQDKPEDLRNAIIKCFKAFASAYKSEVTGEFIYNNKTFMTDIQSTQFYFEALSTLVNEKNYADIIIPKLVEHGTGEDTKIAKISVTCLKNILEEHDNNYIKEYLYIHCNAMEKLSNWLSSIIVEHKCNDVELIENISVIIKILVGNLSLEEQQNVVVNVNLRKLLILYWKHMQLRDQIIILLEGFIVFLRPEVLIPDKYSLIKEILTATTAFEEQTYMYTCMIIANIINKSDEDENFLNILNEIEKYISNAFEDNSSDLYINNCIQLISWVTKSLIIKGSNKSENWTDQLILLLEKYENVAKSFKLIMDDSYDCLSEKSYCKNRLLYRQKFFAYVCKKLSSKYNENTPNYLLALGYLIEFAPQQVFILYFKETLRLLILCLEKCKNDVVLAIILNKLHTLIKSKEQYLENYIDELIPRFLILVYFEPSMKVRILALKCLQDFPNNYPLYKLIPHKQDVIFGLASSLDDKKRLVRKQAVEARLHWFLLDAPT